jgi:anti-sigma factor RsiW
MNCKDVRENLIELLSAGQADPAVAIHVKECSACAAEMESLRKTMALLDEWEAPEPSPYFLTRLQAHVREERDKKPEGFFGWLRQPWLVTALATVLVAGGAVYLGVHPIVEPGPPAAGTAVSDLESLERNHDLYLNSDLLDELSGNPSEDVTD